MVFTRTPLARGVRMGFSQSLATRAAALALGSLLAMSSVAPMHQAIADGGTEKFKFPPIDSSKKDRCKFISSAMGQANAARDKLYDLRECKMAGADASTFDLSGALMEKGDFSNANFRETQLSKVYAPGAIFDGADFSNGVVDRAYFNGASFKGTIFANAVLSGTTFDNADLSDTDFTDAYIGQFDQKKLCKNPTLKGENAKTGAVSRESVGCTPVD